MTVLVAFDLTEVQMHLRQLGKGRISVMIEGFVLAKRWPSDDYVCDWYPDESWDMAARNTFSAVTSLAEAWRPLPAHLGPPDTPQLDINWFSEKSPVLHDDAGNAAFRKILSLTGEWLPLAGEAQGLSVYHSVSGVTVRKDDCVSPTRNTVIWALDESMIVADRLLRVAGLGHVWFEDDGTDGLRSVVAEHELSGVGFVKCWDDTGEFEFDDHWHWSNDAGEFWADWEPR